MLWTCSLTALPSGVAGAVGVVPVDTTAGLPLVFAVPVSLRGAASGDGHDGRRRTGRCFAAP